MLSQSQAISLPGSVWTNLGTGPLSVMLADHQQTVSLIASAASPVITSSSEVYVIGGGGVNHLQMSATEAIWAYCKFDTVVSTCPLLIAAPEVFAPANEIPSPYSYSPAQSAVAVVSEAVTTAQILQTVTIPANSLNVNGALRITALLSMTNNANAKALTVSLEGETVNAAVTGSLTSASQQIQLTLRNRGVLNSQVMFDSFSNTGSAAVLPVYSNVDFSQAQTITFTLTLANATDVVTLEAYSVEVLNTGMAA